MEKIIKSTVRLKITPTEVFQCGFGWGNGRGLVGCDWISHHIPIAYSFPEILHATRVSTTQCFIQSLMHLSASILRISPFRWLLSALICLVAEWQI